MRQKIIQIEFSKINKEVNVKIGSDDLRKHVQANDALISEHINYIKKLIPDKYGNKVVKIKVFISGSSKNPIIVTTIKYSIFLSGVLRDVVEKSSSELNKLFRQYVIETIKGMKSADDRKVSGLENS